MAHRRPPTTPANGFARPRGTFRQRYNELEGQRDSLLVRLRKLDNMARVHPSSKRAIILLNETFRKSNLAQRLAVLQAAAWLIDLLERITAVI
jgi:hypothetical protein